MSVWMECDEGEDDEVCMTLGVGSWSCCLEGEYLPFL